jgi:hypothetical protein
MSRGLTEQPNPEDPGVDIKELEGALEELYAIVSGLYAKVDTLEKILGHALDLPEAEAVDRKRVNGL